MGQAIGAAAERLPPSLSIGNNCIVEEGKRHQKLQTNHKRIAEIVRHEAIELGREFGIDRLGFLTLTFPDHVTQLREAQRRFRSLRTNVIQPRYERAIAIWERSKNQRIHFHLVVVCAQDIRTGINWQQIDDDTLSNKQRYSSANEALHDEWAYWREILPKYGFGRHELYPVRKTVESLAVYAGKYLGKHVAERSEEDKGARLVRFIGYRPEERKGSLKFHRNTEAGWRWRMRVKEFCRRYRMSFEEMEAGFGSKWQKDFEHVILSMPVDEVHRSFSASNRYQNEQAHVHLAAAKVVGLKEQAETRGAKVYTLGDRVYDGSPSWNIPEEPPIKATVELRKGGFVFTLSDRTFESWVPVVPKAIPSDISLTQSTRDAWRDWVSTLDEEGQRTIQNNIEARKKERLFRYLKS